MCVCARLIARERSRAVCDGLRGALATYGAPEQILTDNGKVFTGRFHHPPVEVLFDAICRQHGIEHLLTQPRSPTTTGKIERFHRSLRAEFLSNQARFSTLNAARQALNEWVEDSNTDRQTPVSAGEERTIGRCSEAFGTSCGQRSRLSLP